MAKKSKDKRFRIIVQVGIWNSTMTRVYRYERQTVLVTAKSAKKALEKACVKGTVLRVVQWQHCQGVSRVGRPIECYRKHSKGFMTTKGGEHQMHYLLYFLLVMYVLIS